MTFEEFWGPYPRKVAKWASRKEWERLNEEERAAAIAALPLHVRYWDACGTAREFIPHARTWLHQHRWEDELEMPGEAEWWKTERGVLNKGASIGLAPRPGEDMVQFKQRIVDKLMRRTA